MNPTSLAFPQKGQFSKIFNHVYFPQISSWLQDAKPHKFIRGEPVSPSREPPRWRLSLQTLRPILKILTQWFKMIPRSLWGPATILPDSIQGYLESMPRLARELMWSTSVLHKALIRRGWEKEKKHSLFQHYLSPTKAQPTPGFRLGMHVQCVHKLCGRT